MNFWISILVVNLFCGQTSAVVDKRFPTDRNGDKMTNVVEKNGFLFVAENGLIHQLDLALSPINTLNTCVHESCINVNKVLEVSDDLLVLCGTGNNGVCQALDGSKFVYSSSSVDSHSNYLTVSTNIDAPAVGIAFEGDFYLGRGMKNEDGTTYRNYITRTRIDNNFTHTGSAYIFGEHPVYFKSAFQHNRTISFLTNQRYNLTSTKTVSKLIHINADVLSFTETILTCQADEDDYSLLQDGVYLPAKGVLVAAFSQGDDPENPLSNSAVCVYDIGALSGGPISILKLDNTRIARLKGIDRYGLYPDVFVGTDTGSVIKMSVDDSLQVNIYGNHTGIDKGHPITDIHIGEEKGYVITNRKISSFKNTECSIFSTCKETMAVRNPICGWCLEDNRLPKRSDCPGGWISSLSECVSIDASPKYVAVSQISATTLTITAENIPENVPKNVACLYRVNGNQIGGYIEAAKVKENIFKCNINSKQEHTELTVQLDATDIYIDNDGRLNIKPLFLYAVTTIEIYKCANYTTCGGCLQSEEIECHWCPTNLICQNNGTVPSCPQPKFSRDFCPRLVESGEFVPNGITKNLTLTVENMITDVNYTCVIEKNGTSVEIPALVHNGRVKVPLYVSFGEDNARMVMPLFLFQVNGQTISKVENTIHVTVYKCERLGTDCTKCGALKPNRYDCKWCESGQCAHTSRCSQNIACPLPQITEVYPSSGGYDGGTELIITGSDFGTNRYSINGVMVGMDGCRNIEVVQTDSSDFDVFIKEIRCRVTRRNDINRVGTHNVTFLFNGGKVGNGIYSFQNPIVSNIEPSFGAVIGGTLVTLIGQHLGIDSILPRIRFGSVGLCSNVQHSNQTLTCLTPYVSRYMNISRLGLIWWGSIPYDSNISFQYLPTPNITNVSSLKSVISGGTTLISTGINLKNAAKVSVTVMYAREIETVDCIPTSDVILECLFPRAPGTVVGEMEENIGNDRNIGSTADNSITTEVSIKMDGYVKTFEVDYYRDPIVDPFRETIMIPYVGKKRLTITGNYLDLAGGLDDYKVLISDENCLVIDVARRNITCIPPDDNLDSTAEKLEVEVQLGNFKQTVGYVRYEAKVGSAVADNANYTLGIVLSGISVVLFIAIIIGVVLFCYKYRRAKARIPKIKMRKRKKSEELTDISTSRPQTEPVVDNHSNGHNVVERSVYTDLDENRGRPVYQDLDHHGHDNLDVSDYQGLDQRQDYDNHVYTGLG